MAYSLTLILLSGPIASGKTTLARNLAQDLPAEHISTSGLISAAAGRDLDRSELQRSGHGTGFQGADWISGAVRQIASTSPMGETIIVDAVRTLEQVNELREAAAGIWRILHVHLHGEDRELASRHELNGATDLALTFADYADARNRGARRFNQLTDQTIEFINEMEAVAGAPVSFVSVGFDGRGPIDRRLW